MARRVTVVPPDVLRARIARAILGAETADARVGEITLYPHQRAAITAAHDALARFGGALLADAVGLGKTYVALAVAKAHERPLVIAPAVLREQWRAAASRMRVAVEFVSVESLSRGPPAFACDFIVVDEAHHFRNPATKRYGALARLGATKPMLLLSGTPVHNRRADLAAQLALFLGARAAALSAEDLAACVIRREHVDVPFLLLPELRHADPIRIPVNAAIGDAISALPPPVPVRDGAAATTLVRLGLAHMWASSDAALLAGIRRRIARGTALRDSLLAGRYPTARELASWIGDSQAVQLGFPELLVEASGEGGAHLEAIDRHLAALRELRASAGRDQSADDTRVRVLCEMRARHPRERIVAFSAYAETVMFLFHSLRRAGRVAALTGNGGTIASGALSTREVLAAFRAPRAARERIDLLLATDLLSEGVNLQAASVVVHLDLPWTAARLEQRVGRVRRPGGNVPRATVYRLALPPRVEQKLGRELLLRRKARTAEQLVGAGEHAGDTQRRADSAARAAQKLRQLVRLWVGATDREGVQGTSPVLVSAVWAHTTGCVAVLCSRGRLSVAAWYGDTAPAATRDPRHIHDLLAGATADMAFVEAPAYRRARRAVERLLRDERVTELAGAGPPPAPVVGRLLARLDSLLAGAPLHSRAPLAARLSAVRAGLADRLTAGLERELQEIVRSGCDSAFLRQCEALLTRVRPAEAARPGATVIGLMLLRPRSAESECSHARQERRNASSRPRIS